jgi:hypothetical protein
MKRLLTLLSLFLLAGCASNDGFVEDINTCEPGAEVGIDAGWDMQASAMETGSARMTLLVRVSNNSNDDITVKRIAADPMNIDRDSRFQLERGSREPNQVIAAGGESTFEIPMNSTRQYDSRGGRRANSSVDLSVTVWLDSDQSYRCRFRVPTGF